MALDGQEFTQFSYFINNKYEPKRKNRFMLHIANIPILSGDSTAAEQATPELHSGLMIALDTAKRPAYEVGATEIRRYNERSFYAEAPSHDKTMACEFWDYINDAAASPGDPNAGYGAGQVLYRWFKVCYNLDFGSMGFKKDYATTADLYMLDPHGKQIEHWHYTNFWCKGLEYGDLGFSATDPAKITATFQFDKAKLLNAIDSTEAPGAYSSSEYS